MRVEEITVSMAGLAWVRGTGRYGGARRPGRHLGGWHNGDGAAHEGSSDSPSSQSCGTAGKSWFPCRSFMVTETSLKNE